MKLDKIMNIHTIQVKIIYFYIFTRLIIRRDIMQNQPRQNLSSALQFVANKNKQTNLHAVIAEFQKGLNDVSGTPCKTTVEDNVPPVKPISEREWSEWADAATGGPNQQTILTLLQQLSLLNFGNSTADLPEDEGEFQVTDKT